MSRKIYLLLLPLLFIVLVATILAPIERLVVRRYLLANVEGLLGHAVAMGDSSFQDGVLVIDKPIMQTDDDSVSAVAEQLRVSYRLSFWQRHVHLDIEWIRPRITLVREAPAVHYNGVPDFWSLWLRSDVTFKVAGGQIFWKGDGRDVPVAAVDADFSLGLQAPQGTLAVALTGGGSRGLTLTLGDQPTLALKLQAMPVDLLTSLMRLWPGARWPFEANQGSLSGHLDIVRTSSGYKPRGQLTVDNVAGLFTNMPLFLGIKEGKLILASAPGDKEETVVHVQGSATLASADRAAPRSWKIEGFKGQMSLGSSGLMSVSCRGQWRHDSVVKALRFDGRRASESLFDGVLSFVGADGSEGRVDLQLSQERLLSGRVTHLDAAEIALLRQLASSRIPLPSSWHLSRGSVDGQFSLTAQGFAVESIVAKDIELRTMPNGLAASAARLQGSLSFGEGLLNHIDLAIADGALSSLSTRGTEILVTGVQGKCVLNANRADGDDIAWTLDHQAFRLEGMGKRVPGTEVMALSMPVVSASILDKLHNVTYNDISALIEYQDGRLLFSQGEASVEGMSVTGEALITGIDQAEGMVGATLKVMTLSGTVDQLKNYLHHFDGGDGFLHRLPIEGVVTVEDSGGLVEARLTPDGIVVEGAVKGEVSDGVLNSRLQDVTLREMGMRFAFAYPSKVLAISDLQGTLLVGRPGRSVEEYRIFGDRILMTGYPGERLDFDIWVGDKVRDVIRVSGEAHAGLDADDQTVVDFTFDKGNTHFGNVHPKVLELSLRGWGQVSKAEVEMQFDLSTLLRDIQRLSRTGLPLLSQRIQDELQSLSKAKGNFSIAARYDRSAPVFSYDVKGVDVIFDDHTFDEVSLVGSVQGDSWVIDQLKIDDLSFAADLQRYDDRWKVNFLGMRCAGALMLGMEGDYFVDSSNLKGRINLLELNLSQFKGWEMTGRFAQRYQPRGEVRANGVVEVQVLPAPSWAHITATLDGSFRALELGGVRFRDGQHIQARFDSNQGLALENIMTAIVPSRYGERPIELETHGVRYDMRQGELAIEQGRFHAPNGTLGWLSDLFKVTLGQTGYQLIRQVADKVVSQQGLNGEFSLNVGSNASQGSLKLDGGTYMYNGQPYVLKDLIASYDPYEMSVGGQLDFRGKPLWVTFRNQCPLAPYGQLYLSDRPASGGNSEAYRPMVLSWECGPEAKFGVRKVEGRLFGVEANLAAIDDFPGQTAYAQLQGELSVDVQDLLPLLPTELASGLQRTGVKGRYLLEGLWQVNSLMFDGIQFQGRAKADQWELSGYLIDSLSAGVELNSRQLQLTEVVMQDAAGRIEAPQILLSRLPGHRWSVSIPEMTATDVMPATLRKAQGSSRRRSGVSVPKATLVAVSGDIGDVTSIKGEGSLRFTHTNRKKGGKEGFRAFTSDIMSKIGLDLDLVTPTSGTVDYQIRDGYLVITRLKDVYSQGKLAKFVLPKEGKPATIDFDGNVDVAVKLRPSQPLLKIADKVTLNIQGTVRNPVVTLD